MQKEKLTSKINIKEAIYLAIIVLALYLFFSVGLKAILGTEVPIAVVESGSMQPTLNIGDVILVKGINPKEIKVSDIIVYKRISGGKEIYIVHRVIEIYNDKGNLKFRTKGDNNLVPDYWLVDEKDVVGIVVFKIPLIGYVSLAIQSNPVIYYLVIFAIVVLFLSSILKRNK
jgi:signal peptidase